MSRSLISKKYKTILADPPWQYNNKTGKSAPEHKRLRRYSTMDMDSLKAMRPMIDDLTAEDCHLWMWCTWPMIQNGLDLMAVWGFQYKTGIPWLKVAKNGEPDGRCMGFYGRVVTEMILFGVRSKSTYRTKPPHNTKNIIIAQKQAHSEKPDDQYSLIESQSHGPYIELFARKSRDGWDCWGDEAP